MEPAGRELVPRRGAGDPAGEAGHHYLAAERLEHASDVYSLAPGSARDGIDRSGRAQAHAFNVVGDVEREVEGDC